jgi:hypothetical protein
LNLGQGEEEVVLYDRIEMIGMDEVEEIHRAESLVQMAISRHVSAST